MAARDDHERSRVLALLAGSCCVMSSAHDGRHGGLLVSRVLQCADEPPCVLVALPKGHRLATLIRDSHAFALTILNPTQRLVIKKFREYELPEPGVVRIPRSAAAALADPFDMFESIKMPTGCPVIARGLGGIDCEVMRHFDLEADHEVYVGLIIATALLSGGRERTALHTAAPRSAGSNGRMNGDRAGEHGAASGHGRTSPSDEPFANVRTNSTGQAADSHHDGELD